MAYLTNILKLKGFIFWNFSKNDSLPFRDKLVKSIFVDELGEGTQIRSRVSFTDKHEGNSTSLEIAYYSPL